MSASSFWTYRTDLANRFVEFETAADLKVAVEKLDNQDFKGSNVRCIADVCHPFTPPNPTPWFPLTRHRLRPKSPEMSAIVLVHHHLVAPIPPPMVATTTVVVTRFLAVTIARLVILVTVVARLHRVTMSTVVILAAIAPRLLALLQSIIRIRMLGTITTVTILTRLSPGAVTMTPRILQTGIRLVGRDPPIEVMRDTMMAVRVIGDFSSFAFASSGSFLSCA